MQSTCTYSPARLNMKSATAAALQVPLPLRLYLSWPSAHVQVPNSPPHQNLPSPSHPSNPSTPTSMTSQNPCRNSTLSGPSFCTRLAIPLTRFATPAWPPSPALWLELPAVVAPDRFPLFSSLSRQIVSSLSIPSFSSIPSSSSSLAVESAGSSSSYVGFGLRRLFACLLAFPLVPQLEPSSLGPA